LKNAELRLALIRLLSDLTAEELEQMYARAHHKALKEVAEEGITKAIKKENADEN
jgi:hypothetical protein